MQTPAGFLNFQGTNAVEDGSQTIEIRFTDDKTKGLYIPDLDSCNLSLKNSYRGFTHLNNCSCNSCDLMCTGADIYVPTPVMEGFDYVLVGAVWGGAIGIAIVVTLIRRYRKQKQE
jgi:hypothetical protein